MLPAVRTAPGAARGGAKEKVSPRPGQPRRGIGPFGARGRRGHRVREGRNEAKRGRAAGSKAASGDPATGGAGTGRPYPTARITEERRPPCGAPLGNKLHEHNFERRKKVSMLLPRRLRPSCLCSRGAGWAPARAPSSAPSPAQGLPPLSPAGGRQRRCSSAHYFKSPEYDLTRTESHSERERERASERKSYSPLSSTFR